MKHLTSLFLTIALVACGSDPPSSTANTSTTNTSTSNPTNPTNPTTAPGGTCTSVGTLICEKACSCPGDGKCRVGVLVQGGVATINFDDEEKCLDWYVDLACARGDEPGRDYAACETKLASATCVEAAGDAQAVVLPDECKSN